MMARPFNDSPKRSAFGIRGEKVERLSENFDFKQWPEKATLKVTRQELLALLTRQWAVERDSKFRRRFWRWLKAKLGSGAPVVPQPPEEKKGA
jgi:hypothetical protein